MITIIFDDDIDFYFARQRVTEKLDQAATFLAAGRRALSGSRRDGAGPDLLVHGRSRVPTHPIDPGRLWALNKFYIAPQLNAAPGVADVAIVGGTPLEYQIDVRPEELRAYGITLGELYAAVAKSNMPAGGGVMQKNNAEYIVRGVGWIKDKHDIENTVIKEVNGTPIYVKNDGHRAARHAVPPQRLREGRQRGDRRRRADAARRKPAGRDRARQGEDSGAAARPARRACTSCRPTTARG